MADEGTQKRCRGIGVLAAGIRKCPGCEDCTPLDDTAPPTPQVCPACGSDDSAEAKRLWIDVTGMTWCRDAFHSCSECGEHIPDSADYHPKPGICCVPAAADLHPKPGQPLTQYEQHLRSQPDAATESTEAHAAQSLRDRHDLDAAIAEIGFKKAALCNCRKAHLSAEAERDAAIARLDKAERFQVDRIQAAKFHEARADAAIAERDDYKMRLGEAQRSRDAARERFEKAEERVNRESEARERLREALETVLELADEDDAIEARRLMADAARDGLGGG